MYFGLRVNEISYTARPILQCCNGVFRPPEIVSISEECPQGYGTAPAPASTASPSIFVFSAGSSPVYFA